jgi:hypothetical protein
VCVRERERERERENARARARALLCLDRHGLMYQHKSTNTDVETLSLYIYCFEQRAAPFKADADAVKAALARVAAAGAAISQTMAEVNSDGGDLKKHPRVVAATTEMVRPHTLVP